MGIYTPNPIFQRGNEIFFKNLIQVFLRIFIGKIPAHNSIANRTNEERFLAAVLVTGPRMKTCGEDARHNQLKCSMGKGCIRKGFCIR